MPEIYHCRHYAYDRQLMRASCARGIDNTGPGAFRRCSPSPQGEPCSLREDLSIAEREKRDAERKAMLARFIVCMAAIPNGEPGESGEVSCPSCEGGTIHYGRSLINGHLWGVCTTTNCFAVME